MDRLEYQVVRDRKHRNPGFPWHEPRKEPAQEVPADFTSRFSLEDQARPEPGNGNAWLGGGEVVQEPLLLGLVAAVMRTFHPSGGPRLVPALVLACLGVGAHG